MRWKLNLRWIQWLKEELLKWNFHMSDNLPWRRANRVSGFLTRNSFCECLIRNAMPLFSLIKLSCRSFAVTCVQTNFEKAAARNRKITEKTHAYIFGPDDMRCEHERQVEGGHFVFILLLGGLIEQVKQQFEEAAVGWRQQHEEKLQSFQLALFVRHGRLVAFLVEQRDLCETWRVNNLTSSILQFPFIISARFLCLVSLFRGEIMKNLIWQLLQTHWCHRL